MAGVMDHVLSSHLCVAGPLKLQSHFLPIYSATECLLMVDQYVHIPRGTWP